MRGIRLGIPRPYFFDRLQPDVASAVEAAIALLADLGAEVIETPWSEARVASAAGFVIVRPEMAAVHAETLRSVPERFGPVLRARLEAFSLFPARGYLRARQARSAVRRAMSELFVAHRLDALVTPTVMATATPVGQTTIALPDGEEPVHAGFTHLTMPFNTTGQPALSFPVGSMAPVCQSGCSWWERHEPTRTCAASAGCMSRPPAGVGAVPHFKG